MAGAPRDPEKAALFMRELGRQAHGRLMLHLSIDEGKLRWRVSTQRYTIQADNLEILVKSHYPTASVEEVETPSTVGYMPLRLCRKGHNWYDPIAVQTDFTHLPLISLSQLLNEAYKRQCSVQIVIGLNGFFGDKNTVNDAIAEIKTGMTRTKRTVGRIGLLAVTAGLVPIASFFAAVSGNPGEAFAPLSLPFMKFEQNQGEWQRLQQAKTLNPDKYVTTIGIFVRSATHDMMTSWAYFLGERIRSVYGAKPIANNKPTPTQWELIRAYGSAPVDPQNPPRWMIPDVYTNAELATFWHMPTRELGDELVGLTKESKPSRALLENQEGVVIGTYKNYYVRVPYENRATHINIVGRAGTGKSRLMGDLIRQDLWNGKGVCVIDPHGTLVSEILETGIPNHRVNDVVIYDLSNADSPIPLNPFAITDTDKRPGVGLFRETFARLYPSSQNWGRTQSYLKNALELIRRTDEPTLRDLYKVLADTAYLDKLLEAQGDKLDDITYEFWQKYLGMSDAQQYEVQQPITSRIAGLIQTPILYHALCHPRSIDWNQHIEKKHIVLMSLRRPDKDEAAEDVSLVGTIALGQLNATARSRGENGSSGFFVYVDEAQLFTNSGFDTMFTQIRKWGIGLTIANQYLGQLSAQDHEAISTAGVNVIFQPSLDDAKELHPLYKGHFEPEQVLKLNLRQAVAIMRLNRVQERPFLIKTVTTPDGSKDRARQIRLHAAKTHRRMTANEVEQFLHNKYPRRRAGGNADQFGQPKT
jgi:hypothetical protein